MDGEGRVSATGLETNLLLREVWRDSPTHLSCAAPLHLAVETKAASDTGQEAAVACRQIELTRGFPWIDLAVFILLLALFPQSCFI